MWEKRVDFTRVEDVRLLGLGNGFLDISNIDAGKFAVSIEPVAAHGIIDASLNMVRELGSKHDVSINEEYHRAPELQEDFYVMADRKRLHQVLLNFLSNAIKYNCKGGKVEVSCALEGSGSVRFSVTDNGPGISKHLKNKIFQSFHRLRDDRAEEGSVGTGLMVARKLVKLMGGTIGFSSEEGVGSTFWVSFPLANKSTVADISDAYSSSVQEVDSTQIKKATVLYVDDNAANLVLMSKLTKRISGMELITASTAEIGLAMAEQLQLALILMDINLPGMSGIEAFQQIQLNPRLRHIPVVAVSANALSKDIDRAMLSGFESYITKPFVLDDVINVITSHI